MSWGARLGGSELGRDPARTLLIPLLVAVPLALALGLGGVTHMAALAIFAVGGGTFLANPRAFILGFLMLISLRTENETTNHASPSSCTSLASSVDFPEPPCP